MHKVQKVRRVLLLALVACGTAAVPASAQPRAAQASVPSAPSTPVDGRTQVSLAGLWQGGVGLGSQPAVETQNQAGGGAYTLFKTESRLEPAGGFELRLTVWLTRAVAVEAGGSWATPRLATRVTGDVEHGADTTAAVDVAQYVVDGSVLVRFLTMANGRAVAFGLGGVGYLRQLYDGNVLVETGTIYHAGGGVLYWFHPARAGWLKRTGIRADARWTLHDGGVTLGGGRRALGVFAAGVALQF